MISLERLLKNTGLSVIESRQSIARSLIALGLPKDNEDLLAYLATGDTADFDNAFEAVPVQHD